MFYPIKFIPVYKDYLWGGRNLEKLGRTLPEGIVAESWEVSAHPDGVSIVANGKFAGRSLPELLAEFGEQIVGTALSKIYAQQFPLLIKLIDANKKLSVQVHPDDDYARTHEGDCGKNEMWYIIAAEPGAEIIYGLIPGTTRDSLGEAVRENRIESCLQTIPVAAGDVFNIPAGTVHGLGAGIVLVEIQQSSNLTYRLYDYNRTDARGNKRPIHIEKAMEVINFDSTGQAGKLADISEEEVPGLVKRQLIVDRYFEVDLYQLDGETHETTAGRRFFCYTFMEGSGRFIYQGGTLQFKMAESVLIPAALKDYVIEGKAKFLKVSLPIEASKTNLVKRFISG